MEGVRGIESLAAGDGWHHLSRALGPVLLISMGYIDLGKWVATIDAGARFGYELVILMLLLNLSAILCQYLSICIGMVTGKNLVEAGLPLVTAALTMLSGITVGFNLVFEYDDPIAGLCFAGQKDGWDIECMHCRLCTSLFCAWFISQSTKNSS